MCRPFCTPSSVRPLAPGAPNFVVAAACICHIDGHRVGWLRATAYCTHAVRHLHTRPPVQAPSTSRRCKRVMTAMQWCTHSKGTCGAACVQLSCCMTPGPLSQSHSTGPRRSCVPSRSSGAACKRLTVRTLAQRIAPCTVHHARPSSTRSAELLRRGAELPLLPDVAVTAGTPLMAAFHAVAQQAAKEWLRAHPHGEFVVSDSTVPVRCSSAPHFLLTLTWNVFLIHPIAICLHSSVFSAVVCLSVPVASPQKCKTDRSAAARTTRPQRGAGVLCCRARRK